MWGRRRAPLRPRAGRGLFVVLGLALIPALGSAALRAAASEDQDPRALLQEAVALQREGRFEEAVRRYEQVVTRIGPEPRVLSNLAAAYASLGRFEDAIARYRRALEQEPGSASIRLNLAFALDKAGQVAEAVGEAEAVLAAGGETRASVLFLADGYLRLGRSADVVSLLEPRTSALGDDKAFSYLLGTALLREGELSRARAFIDRVLRDGSPEAHVMLALMHVQRGDCDAAQGELDSARSSGPGLPTAGYLRGRCLMEEKDWAGALSAFREELAVDAHHFDSRVLVASLLYEAGREEEALPHAEQALAQRPRDPAARLILGRIALASGRPEDALPHLQAAAEAFPDDKKTRLNLALAYHRLGRTADAELERQAVERIEREAQARASASVREAVARAYRDED